MKTLLVQGPFALITSGLIVQMAITAVGLRADPHWVLAALAVLVLLLLGRAAYELVAILSIILLSKFSAFSQLLSSVTPDVWLSMVMAVVFLPVALRLLGMDSGLDRS